MRQSSEIYMCPQCDDTDCQFNALGLCYQISTILQCVPSGMFTCSGAEYDANICYDAFLPNTR